MIISDTGKHVLSFFKNLFLLDAHCAMLPDIYYSLFFDTVSESFCLLFDVHLFISGLRLRDVCLTSKGPDIQRRAVV